MAVNPHNPNPVETLELKDQPRLDADITKGKRFEGHVNITDNNLPFNFNFRWLLSPVGPEV